MRLLAAAVVIGLVAMPSIVTSARADSMEQCVAKWNTLSDADKARTTFRSFTSQCRRGGLGSALPVHSTQNWVGVYRGTLPCADCQGIETVVVLKPDLAFTKLTKYLGKGDEIISKTGRFTWNAQGNTVTLAGDAQYLVGEKNLTRLAQDGSRITGANADRYVLNKIPQDAVTGRYWQLVELNGKPLPKLDHTPWFILNEADGRISGVGACNNFSGSFKLDEAASRISFEKIATTQMMCISGMDVEEAFHDMLRTVDNYSLNGDRLSLNRARMAPLARFEAVYLR